MCVSVVYIQKYPVTVKHNLKMTSPRFPCASPRKALMHLPTPPDTFPPSREGSWDTRRERLAQIHPRNTPGGKGSLE